VLPVTAVGDGVAPWPVIAPCSNWVCGQGRAQERLGLSRKRSASPLGEVSLLSSDFCLAFQATEQENH
jgi:hypothetical protein